MNIRYCLTPTLLVLSLACSENQAPPIGAPSVQVELVAGRLWADFRTPTTDSEDNVRCMLEISINNLSASTELHNGRIEKVEILSPSPGRVLLQTSWDGFLAPGGIDTITLTKLPEQGITLDPVPCDELISFRVILTGGDDSEVFGEINWDSELFECDQ